MKLSLRGFSLFLLGLVIWNPITAGMSPTLGGLVTGIGIALIIISLQD